MSRETTIRQTHSAMTLEALEALANKGLLRRAQKDLERGEVAGFEMTEQGLVVTVSTQQVTLIEAGPAKATCTCPAPGVCQHIIAACLQIMQQPLDEPAGDAHAEWLALTEEQVVSTYSLPVLRVAHELAQANAVQIERAGVLTVRFPSLNAEIVALPGSGLAGIIVNGLNEKKHAQLAAAAILAVWNAAGRPWMPPALESMRSAPIHREDVLKSVITVLEEAVTTGLARLSSGLIERLDAISISAQTAGLHRLSLLLQRIATQSTDWLQRRPHADLGLIFAEMATAYALAHARPQLAAGVGRESYIEVGSLDLCGVAAWPWRTLSGYEGLTLLFWDAANACWNTWSDARPKAFVGGFSAVARHTQPGPWEGAESPAQLSRSRFRLMQGKRNRWGRLSSSAQSKALVTGAADLSLLPCCEDWSKLDTASSFGLRERDPRAAYQVIAPSSWIRCPFDPVTQMLSWQLCDNGGRVLRMQIPFDDLARPAIEWLERQSESSLISSRLVGRFWLQQNQLTMFPFALIKGNAASSLLLNHPIPAVPTPDNAPQENQDWDDIEEEPPDESSSVVSAQMNAVSSVLEWLAEAGSRACCQTAIERLDELACQLSAAPRLARSLRMVASPSRSAPQLLRSRWLVTVMQRAGM